MNLRPGRISLLVGLLAAAIFSVTLGYDFTWDNMILIRENHYIKYARHIPDFFRLDYSSLSHGVIAQGFFRPLLALSFFVDYQMWGLNPFGYHLTNVLFHAAASALVCLLAFRLSGARSAGMLAGVIFAIHPVHIESVAFISGRVDVVAAVFFLGGVLLFLRGTPWTATASAACYAAGLLMKEMAVTLPGILLVAAVAFGQEPCLRKRWVGSLRSLIPHAVVLLAYGLVRLQVSLPQLLAGKGDMAADPLSRVLTAVATVGKYAQLTLFLFEPTPFYAGRLIIDPLAPAVLFGLGVLVAGGWLMVRGWQQERTVAFGALWFLLTLLPVANLLPIPGVRDAAIAERYLYIPSIGACMAIGAAGVRLAAWAGQRGIASRSWGTGALLLIAVGLYLPITLRWTPIWENNERLYRQMVRRSPEAAFPHISLAGELLMRGQSDEPKALIARALALEPALPEVHLVDGATRLAFGDLDGAIAAVRRAQSLAPNSVPVLIELGTTLAERQELAEAIQAFRRALALEPHAVEAYNRMGVAFFGAGQFEPARQAFQQACELSPDSLLARSNLAATLHRMGRIPEALAQLEVGLRLAPADPRLRSLLAEILSRFPRPIPDTTVTPPGQNNPK